MKDKNIQSKKRVSYDALIQSAKAEDDRRTDSLVTETEVGFSNRVLNAIQHESPKRRKDSYSLLFPDVLKGCVFASCLAIVVLSTGVASGVFKMEIGGSNDLVSMHQAIGVELFVSEGS